MGKRGALFCWAGLFLCGAGNLFAQVAGRAAGQVVDGSGAPVPDAVVQLYLPAGSQPVAATRTDREGRYQFAALRPEFYELTVDAQGFARQTVRALKVDPALETLLAPVVMQTGPFGAAAATVAPQAQAATPPVAATVVVAGEQFRFGLGSTAAPLEISEQQQGPRTESVEVASTFTREQVRALPAMDRDPMALLRTQAGINLVAVDTFLTTIVNGQRASYANLTLDGINIQPNLSRDNALGSEFNRFYLDHVSEFTVLTSNASAAQPMGASQVVFVTPSGTNRLHGALYWYHRNKALVANNWIDNSRGLEQPAFAQNQFGTALQGPVRKDRFLLYGTFEGVRRRQRNQVTRVLPTATIRQGLFRYLDNAGNVRQLDLLRATGAPIHPDVQAILNALPPADRINDLNLRGDSLFGIPLNTGGYSFPLRRNLDRNSVLLKPDWILNSSHAVTASFNYARDERDEPLYYTEGYANVPVFGGDRRIFGSAAWRWNPTAQFTNEVRGGAHLLRIALRPRDPVGSRLINLPTLPLSSAPPLFTNPVNPYLGETRRDQAYSLQDHASWMRGRHSLQFGFQYQRLVAHYADNEYTLPSYTLGFTAGAIPAELLPGADAFTVANANAWATTLAGVVSSTSASFYPTSRASGYTSGAPYERRLSFPQWSGYVFDTWRAHPRLTVTAGLRYDWFGVVTERDSLAFAPQLVNGDAVATLLSDIRFDFAGNSAGRPWYPRDRNNFAPQLGLAWDLKGNRRTVLRAGYGIYYVNDEHIRATSATQEFNPGLFLTLTRSFFGGVRFLNENLTPSAPRFSAPLRLSEAVGDDVGTGVALIDPGLRTPYVQQWNLGIQRDFRGMLLEIRYVGSHALKGFRAVDYNQINLRQDGFLDDFRRALQNGRLAQDAIGVFDPRYNAAIAGSQALPYFSRLPGGGALTAPIVREIIRRGEAAELGALYEVAGFAPNSLYRNPLALGGAFLLANRSHTSFHGLQAEVQRRLRRGLQFQANYAFSKVLTDSRNWGATRFEAYADAANPGIERARAAFDLTHVLKGNFLYELPFGRWARGRSRLGRRLLEGWGLSGIVIANSGTPFSIYSGRGTMTVSGAYTGFVNRAQTNQAVTLWNASQLKDVVRFHKTGFGPTMIAESVTNLFGRGAVDPGERPFGSQVFFNPEPGTVGSLQQRRFNGPWIATADASLIKSTRLFESHALEFRLEARNVFNSPAFVARNQDINSVIFGYFMSTVGDSERQVQVGLFYRF
jgi:hypothetical protein